MARSRIITVGDLPFPTKASAKEHFRAIRDRYGDGERLSAEDQGVVFDLLGLHPESCSKVGCGLAFFTVETEREFGRTRHFVIHRLDGSFTDFSFHACIDGRSIRRDILEALRRAIAGQIVEFRESFFSSASTALCPLSGTAISRNSYHVDHAPPAKFMVLIERWLAGQALALEQVQITPPGDAQIVTEMTCPAQRASWKGFHLQEARLRMLSPLGNLSHANRRQHFE